MTGEELIQRDDDREETVQQAPRVYHAQTEPLVAYYAKWAANGDSGAPKYRKVDGLGSVDAMRDAAIAALRVECHHPPGSDSMPTARNAFYAQSGGVTAVINASAAGVIETARKHKSTIGKVYAGRNGIIGALTEDLIDTSAGVGARDRGAEAHAGRARSARAATS